MPVDLKMQPSTKNGIPGVMIDLDMSSYCMLLREYEVLVKHHQSQHHCATVEATDDEEPETSNVQSTFMIFPGSNLNERLQAEKDSLFDLVRSINGSILGQRLIELLKHILSNGTEAEQSLAHQLALPDQPLIFECLELSFYEMLKNSMDATIDLALLTGLIQNMQLRMFVSVQLLPSSQVKISIEDNAGGFSAQYLEGFNASIQEKKYLQSTYPSHKTNSVYYLGGRGRGVSILCAMFLNGLAVETNCTCPHYDSISCLDSSISVYNSDRGAVIELKGNSRPAVRYIRSTVTSPDKSDREPAHAPSIPQMNAMGQQYSSVLQHRGFFSGGAAASSRGPASRIVNIRPLNVQALEESIAKIEASKKITQKL